MTLQQILTGSGGVILIALTLIQIMPVKIDPWSRIAKIIGRAINGEVIDKVDELGESLQLLRDESEEREAITCRTRILRFGDEIIHGTEHTKEHFDQILADIDYYEQYCGAHPKFRNNKAVATIERIKAVYQKCLRENLFL